MFRFRKVTSANLETRKLPIALATSNFQGLLWMNLTQSQDSVTKKLFFFEKAMRKVFENTGQYNALPSFCEREHLKMFPFVKIDIFYSKRVFQVW